LKIIYSINIFPSIPNRYVLLKIALILLFRIYFVRVIHFQVKYKMAEIYSTSPALNGIQPKTNLKKALILLYNDVE